MNNIKITISGSKQVGKTGILFILKEFFKEKGFNLDINADFDYRNEDQLDNLIGFGNKTEFVVDALKNNLKITLEENHDGNS